MMRKLLWNPLLPELGQTWWCQNTGKVYVSDPSGNRIGVIHPGTNRLSFIRSKSLVEPVGVAVNPRTNRIYIADLFDPYGGVTVIDGWRDTIITTIRGRVRIARGPVTKNPGPGSVLVEVNPFTNLVYASLSNTNPGGVWKIDGTTNTILTTIQTGLGTRGMVIAHVGRRYPTVIYAVYNGSRKLDRRIR